MKQRWITGICIVAVLFPLIYIGGIPFMIAAAFLMAVACFEITRLVNKKWPALFNASLYVFFFGLLVAGYFDIEIYLAVDILIIIYLFGWEVFNVNITLDQIAMVYLLFNIFGLLLMGVWEFYEINKMLIFLMIVGTCVTDAFALFGGKAFGKHKMDERVSPNKTWEGAIIGYIVGAVSTFLFGYFVIKTPLALIILAALLEPAVGQIGDLAFSSIKRHFGIKDFGNIFPGHGGVLDRLDSISFNTILLYVLTLILL